MALKIDGYRWVTESVIPTINVDSGANQDMMSNDNSSALRAGIRKEHSSWPDDHIVSD